VIDHALLPKVDFRSQITTEHIGTVEEEPTTPLCAREMPVVREEPIVKTMRGVLRLEGDVS
jgi:hypothetical protein